MTFHYCTCGYRSSSFKQLKRHIIAGDLSHRHLTVFRCKCGEVYVSRQLLAEHIGLANPHWPRTSPDDLHAALQESI